MDKQEQLRAMGHELEVFRSSSGRGFIIRCCCGYGGWQPPSSHRASRVPSVTCATFTEAIRTANWHADNVLSGGVQEDRQNGGAPRAPRFPEGGRRPKRAVRR